MYGDLVFCIDMCNDAGLRHSTYSNSLFWNLVFILHRKKKKTGRIKCSHEKAIFCHEVNSCNVDTTEIINQ